MVNREKELMELGGLPRAFLAGSARGSFENRTGYIRTFIEKDLPQLGINVGSSTLRRFWIMLAHYHGQTWNSSELARAFGVADTTVRNYLDQLTTAPKATPSMRSALKNLKLDRLDVVHAGEHTFPLAEGIRAIPLPALLTEPSPLQFKPEHRTGETNP